MGLFNLKPRKSAVKHVRGKLQVRNLPQLGVHPLGGAAVRPLPGALSELRIESPPPVDLQAEIARLSVNSLDSDFNFKEREFH